LALELKRRGHRPVVATSAIHRETVERAGVAFHPVRPDLEPNDEDLLRRVMGPRGTSVILNELLVPFIRDSYADLESVARGADLLVTHPVTFAGPLVAERLGLRWASVVLAPMSFFSAQDLPVFPGMGWAVHLRRLGPWAARGLLGIARAVTRPWLRPVVRFRRELGLADRGDPLYEGQFSPSLTLALFSRVMGERQKDWPHGVRVTGFVPYTGGVPMPSELDDFLGSGEPPIVFTLGSSAVGAAGSFYAESARAAAALGARAVLLAGRSAGDLARSAASSRVFSAEYAPHDELFSRSRAVVHHGGIGTTGQVLRSGRPMLVVPFAHDQPDNAARVARLGVARVLQAQRYDARSATRRLRELLGGGFGERATRVAGIVRQEDGAARAADELQRLLDDDHL
jgi:UDP:flavonoid glycosyltransferase YjiC (YdhE family)